MIWANFKSAYSCDMTNIWHAQTYELTLTARKPNLGERIGIATVINTRMILS